jgi:DNA-binding MarR family transcriptional regulator
MRPALTDGMLISEVITRLARFTHGAGNVCGLTSAQWSALRFFARSAQHSRTVTAFADYHLTTHGTASQTVKVLVDKQLVGRTPSKLDGRIVRIDLTDKGREIWAKDPINELVREIAALPEAQQASLMAVLPPLLDQMASERQVRSFGLCSSCRYLSQPVSLEGEEAAHFCRKHRSTVSALDLRTICMNYELHVVAD